ncbi:MAG TPA: prolyl oligopeptidase family serine peptidase [Vicinamibacterales bacterium]|nr:prolyl oligopeptidase family serine peptidase [Vicinamibacterales bacterium]
MKKGLFVVVVLTAAAAAQAPRPFSLEQVLGFPFPTELVAAPHGSSIAWAFDERGVRNVYAASGPDFNAHRVTPYTEDDGQELTSLAFSPDGRTIVYVRGGDHGSNWPAEGNLLPDPASHPEQPKLQVWAVPAAGGTPKLLGEGDEPAISPKGDRVAFVRDRHIWIAPLDGSKPAEQAFFARGTSGSPVWSPDGSQLAFESNRDDHSFIGIFTDASHPLRYVAASTSRDDDPHWAADGREILFVRQPGRGGVPRSPLATPPSPWSIWVGRDEAAAEAWKSGSAHVDSMPRTLGGANLHWGADNTIVFLSYQDGWPHLYSVKAPPVSAPAPFHPAPALAKAAGGAPKLLTPGTMMVEYVSLSPDGRVVVYNANTGTDSHDVDRRHVFTVPVDGSRPPSAVTSGTGIEWNPVVTGDGATIAFLSSDARRPPLPAIVPVAGGTPRTIATDRIPADFPSAQLVTPEPIVFKASDGVEVHGQIFKTAEGPARRPALVYVHGGPPRQMLLGWHYMDYYANDYAANQYLASRGFLVLSVNYRLGIGYGYAFHNPEKAGARGASEYLDVLAAGKLLQGRSDVDPQRIGIWGGSYGGYLTALALGRNSDIFAAGVDIHGVHNWDRQGRAAPNLAAALAGDGITEADLAQAAKVTYQASPVSSVNTWRSPVLLIHGDDDRNVEFHQTVDLEQRLLEKGVAVDELVIPDDIHDFLLYRTWLKVTTASGTFFERHFMKAKASQ